MNTERVETRRSVPGDQVTVMATDRQKAAEEAAIMELLGAVERGDTTQRRLSRELGIAVGLVNAYIKRCINKGYIKVKAVPRRRYAYYLTPKGFSEKSRLVADYFVHSFDFFRRARASCKTALLAAEYAGHKRLALIGANELTEIAVIVAAEVDIKIVAVVDPACTSAKFVGIPVSDMAAAATQADAAIITSLTEPRAVREAATKTFGASRVYVPSVLAAFDRTDEQRQPAAARKRA